MLLIYYKINGGFAKYLLQDIMENLETKIKNKKAKVAVIGLGYVGLPTAVEIAKAGFFVYGIDRNKERVKQLNLGCSYIADVPAGELKEVISPKKFIATDNYKALKKSDIVLICVPTPLDKNKIPDISYIKSTVGEIKKRLHPGQLIILESSTYPGTTEEVILSALQESDFRVGRNFHLAYSPERIDPGNKNYKLKDVARVVGGATSSCTRLAVQFYKKFIKSEVLPLSSPRAAEMTKLLENTFRLVNISMINEMALLCGKIGIDIWEVIEAAKTKPYGFYPFYPSAKIGGHCIPLDPFYLSWKAKEHNFFCRFIELAGEINEQMPHYIVTKIIWALNLHKKSIRGSKILILGVAYKEGIGDTRESAAFDIIKELLRKGAKVRYHDSYVPELEIDKKKLRTVKLTQKIIKESDCIVILTAHPVCDYDELAKKAKLVIDTKNAVKSRNFKNVFRL